MSHINKYEQKALAFLVVEAVNSFCFDEKDEPILKRLSEE
jgi:hypothetical protein